MSGPPGDNGNQLWWWRAAATTMLGLMATMLVKGCDEWQQTNDAIAMQANALAELSADVRYQVERVQQREQKLNEIEKNLNLLYERTVARFDEIEETMLTRFDQRREAADKIVRDVYDRLNELRYQTRGGNGRPPQPPRE